MFLQVLSSLLLLLSPLQFLFQIGIAQKMTILFRSARLTPHTGSLSPSLLIVCTLKANVSQGRDWCLALPQNAEQTADWFLTNSFRRRKANSVFNVGLPQQQFFQGIILCWMEIQSKDESSQKLWCLYFQALNRDTGMEQKSLISPSVRQPQISYATMWQKKASMWQTLQSKSGRKGQIKYCS